MLHAVETKRSRRGPSEHPHELDGRQQATDRKVVQYSPMKREDILACPSASQDGSISRHESTVELELFVRLLLVSQDEWLQVPVLIHCPRPSHRQLPVQYLPIQTSGH